MDVIVRSGVWSPCHLPHHYLCYFYWRGIMKRSVYTWNHYAIGLQKGFQCWGVNILTDAVGKEGASRTLYCNRILPCHSHTVTPFSPDQITLRILASQTDSFSLKRFMFWDIAPYSPRKVNRRFGGKCHLHLQDWRTGQGISQREGRRTEDSMSHERGCIIIADVRMSVPHYFSLLMIGS